MRYCFARSTGFRPFSLITSSWVRILAMTRLNRKLFGANNFVYMHIYAYIPAFTQLQCKEIIYIEMILCRKSGFLTKDLVSQ